MIKAIVRRENKRNGNKLILVFPEIGENNKVTAYCAVSAISDLGYCHNDITLDYYYTTKPVDYDMSEITRFIKKYENYINGITQESKENIELVKKLIKKT